MFDATNKILTLAQVNQFVRDVINHWKITGSVHGDLRSINIILTPEGTLRLIDGFGDTKARRPDELAITKKQELELVLNELQYRAEKSIVLTTDNVDALRQLNISLNKKYLSNSSGLNKLVQTGIDTASSKIEIPKIVLDTGGAASIRKINVGDGKEIPLTNVFYIYRDSSLDHDVSRVEVMLGVDGDISLKIGVASVSLKSEMVRLCFVLHLTILHILMRL